VGVTWTPGRSCRLDDEVWWALDTASYFLSYTISKDDQNVGLHGIRSRKEDVKRCEEKISTQSRDELTNEEYEVSDYHGMQ